jgi:hypothetical protein
MADLPAKSDKLIDTAHFANMPQVGECSIGIFARGMLCRNQTRRFYKQRRPRF